MDQFCAALKKVKPLKLHKALKRYCDKKGNTITFLMDQFCATLHMNIIELYFTAGLTFINTCRRM